MNKPLVSLCLPTNGVVEWVFPVLDSIFSQGCDNSDFEIVITDNGNNSEFKKLIKEYISTKNNIVYAETNALPFLNEIESYKRASGQLLKFVNHRTKLVPGALQRLIDYTKSNIVEKPITYFSNGVLKLEKREYEIQTFDQFVCLLSYWSSWSTGMTIWKEDLDKLPDDVSSFNELFPHTDVLFAERKRAKYVVDNTVIFDEMPQGKKPKGNYNLYYAFGVEYPRIIEKLLKDGDISSKTFDTVLDENLEFIASLYLQYNIRKQYCSYDLSGNKDMFGCYYSRSQFALKVVKHAINSIIRKTIKGREYDKNRD